MLPLDLSQADIDTVNIIRKTHSNALIRQRIEVLRLVHLGYSRGEVARIVGCHRNTVRNYVKLYHRGGLEEVMRLNYQRIRHVLADKFDSVATTIEQAHCSTIKQVSGVLKKRFNYSAHREAVRNLLHRLGFRRRKLGTYPGKGKDRKAWLEKQAAFIIKLNDLLDRAQQGHIDLGFTDAAHFVFGKFDAYTWQQQLHYRPSGHGRHRLNVYASYDAVGHHIFSMYGEGYVNAEFVVEYMEWLREKCYPDKRRPLHLVLDNARYQHCQLVKQTAHGLNIVLEFLPPYSPNLNLIERLWKYLKKQVGRQCYETKEEFHKAIVKLLKALGKMQHQQNIRPLMTFKFQRFDNAQILSG